MPRPAFLTAVLILVAACSRLSTIGEPPPLTPSASGTESRAMMTAGLPFSIDPPPQRAEVQLASLWTGDQTSLLGDRRAMRRGDILTVVIRINDSAQLSNSTSREREGSEEMAIPSLFGLPARAAGAGVPLDPAVSLDASGSFSGEGAIRRSERLTLRVAATVTDVLPNGVLQIEGLQEVRVNNELRELHVSGFVRPTDITRQNEVSYDRMAAARISYGGRGLITEMQRPRYGQEAAERLLPF